MVSRVTEEVRDAKSDQTPRGIGPTQHLLETRRRFPATETPGDHLVERHKLHRAQRQAQGEHQRQPQGRATAANQPTN